MNTPPALIKAGWQGLMIAPANVIARRKQMPSWGWVTLSVMAVSLLFIAIVRKDNYLEGVEHE